MRRRVRPRRRSRTRARSWARSWPRRRTRTRRVMRMRRWAGRWLRSGFGGLLGSRRWRGRDSGLDDRRGAGRRQGSRRHWCRSRSWRSRGNWRRIQGNRAFIVFDRRRSRRGLGLKLGWRLRLFVMLVRRRLLLRLLALIVERRQPRAKIPGRNIIDNLDGITFRRGNILSP